MSTLDINLTGSFASQARTMIASLTTNRRNVPSSEAVSIAQVLALLAIEERLAQLVESRGYH